MNRRGRASIQGSKPELPPFLKRIKEQIVTNELTIEDKSRKKLRKADERDSAYDKDEAPTIVKLKDGDLTEKEYRRLAEENERKLSSEGRPKSHSRHDDSGSKSSGSPTQSSSRSHRKEQELREKLKARLAADGGDKVSRKPIDRSLLSFDDE